MEKEFLKELIKDRRLFDFLELKKIDIKSTHDTCPRHRSFDFLNFHEALFKKYDIFKAPILNMLKRCLLKNNCTYEMFECEMIKQGKKVEPTVRFSQIINHCLYWDGSLQRHEYWRNIHNKWVRYFADSVVLPLYGKDAADAFYAHEQL